VRVLGIDPGLRLTGYGCIEVRGLDCDLVEAGVIRLTTNKPGKGTSTRGRTAADGAGSVSSRLTELDRDFRAVLKRLAPDVVAVESIFAHYKHPATAIVMGHARGVLLLAIRAAGVGLIELKPNAVKKSLTGHGHADKGAMQRAIQTRFALDAPPRPPDVADALAIALCAATRGATAPTNGTRRGKRLTSAEVARALGA
jgi:crossover junction endodeoxyribonuclease RuvC